MRILQEKTFRRLGSHSEETSDFRLVAATNRHLEHMVGQELFRADLLYRVQALRITLPPLRQRLEDIAALVEHLLKRLWQRYGGHERSLSPDFLPTLCGYHWPGNVRELGNALEQALANAGDAATLFARHLPDSVRIGSLQSQLEAVAPSLVAAPAAPNPPIDRADTIDARPAQSMPTYKEYREKALRDIERTYFDQLLRAVGGDVAQACALSGLGRNRLYDMLRQCGLRLGEYQGQ